MALPGDAATEHTLREAGPAERPAGHRERPDGPEASAFGQVHRDLKHATLKVDEQLAQSQKLEAVGELAGGVAHDFNNLLTVVLGYVEVLLEEVDTDSPLRGDLEGINRAAERASALVHQLLAFSRRQVLQPVVFDVNETLLSLESMLRRLLGEDIELVVRTTRRPALVRADPNQLEQAVVNLAINARDSMPHGGTIGIECATGSAPGPGDDAAGPAAASSGPQRYVSLTVTDTGVGMDEQTLAHCFEPFYTTKAAGRGTGLGLSTVYGVVRQSGGDVWAESEPWVGTTFTLRLPRVDGAIETEPQAERPDRRLGSGTILVVEDEEEVRSLVRRALTRAGYHVLETADGDQALALADRHQGRIDLLITDVVMPNLGGVELAARLGADGRVADVLFISGYLDPSTAGEGSGVPPEKLLPKPFRAGDLLSRVRQVLDR